MILTKQERRRLNQISMRREISNSTANVNQGRILPVQQEKPEIRTGVQTPAESDDFELL